ncbi:Meiotic nuclear division protein 1 -like protein [Echinococcus granulosus]|uniref:Meiotic nuclear division protein 1 homolog n=1 Tax=Echinococcus granulosus TaxID=6210 RepID=A0A068WEP2_ECHGR|nr:Meiotic nuclear division protein 1 -like protein [Echinococcus granulosus]CDS16092.1 meiotic nuclear division protein 1 [Echinococcus granulosus]
MSRRRGLSLDEKRNKMMELFYEKNEFFTLRELERLSHKEKGIPSMTVKDILMSLVSDGLVDSDKIGTSIYFWAFLSKAGQNRRKKIEDLQSEILRLESRFQDMERMLGKARLNKEETTEREEALSTLGSNQLTLEKLKGSLTLLQRYHPSRISELRSQTESAIECANRWTDNVFQVTGWIKNKFGIDDATLAKQFRIPDNFDYIDT